MRPGDQVWDIGAHKGYVTLALARKVGSEGVVTAFEPSEMNLWFLRRHIRWNELGNVRVMPVAVSDQVGHDRFGGEGGTATFRLGRGDEVVRVSTIRGLVEEEGLAAPDVLKIDVEGNEGPVLRGAGELLSDDLVLFVAIHGREQYGECRELLLASGYRLYESRELAVRTADPARRWGGEAELVAVSPKRGIPDETMRNLPLFAG
ncbi:MAG: FkbM family methyltransferase [Gemmatimonadota bacterium]